MPKPRWMPLPQLRYAQVVKSYRHRRLVGVKYRVVFGTWQRVESTFMVRGTVERVLGVEHLAAWLARTAQK